MYESMEGPLSKPPLPPAQAQAQVQLLQPEKSTSRDMVENTAKPVEDIGA